MDQYYYEEGYIEAGYHGYLAEARVDLRPYIEDAYIDPQYYEYYGITVSFAAELTEIVGEVVEAFGTWSSSFTQTATISHIEGADLFAFSEAAISVTVERIRDNNVAVSGVFSTAIDAVRYRDITGDEAAEFAVDANVERSRDAQMAVQAAFSFDSTGSRIRFGDGQFEFTAGLSCTISHIEGADIVVENFASLTATANFTVDNAVAVNATASITATPIVSVDSVFVDITNKFVFFVSRYAGEGRPKNIVRFSGGVESPVVIDTTYKKFGTGSVRPVLPNGSAVTLRSSSSTLNTTTLLPKFEERYAFELWFYVNGSVDRTYAGFGLGLSSLSSDWFIEFETLRRITLHTEESALEKITANNIYNNNTWNHLLLIAEPGTPFVEGEIPPQRIALFLNGTRILTQTRSDFRSRTHPYDFFTMRDGAGADYFYFDEISYWRGTTLGYSIDATTITVPTSPRTNSASNLKFLWHVDADGSDDVSLTQTFSANLQSQFAVTASISGPVRYSADLSSEFTVSAQVSVDRGGDLTAFSTGSLELDAVRVRFGDSSASAEVTVSADSVKITEVTADLVAECAVSADVSRTRDNEITTDSIATQIAVVAKTGNTLVDVNVVSTVTASATLTADRTSSITSNADFAVINQRIRDLASNQTAQSTLSVDALRVKQIAADISSQAQVTAVAVKTVDADTSITSSFDLDVDTSGIKQGIALVFSLGTLDISETLFKNFDAELDVIASQTTVTTDSLNKGGEAILSSDTILAITATRIQQAEIATESIATQLAAVAKIGRVVTAMDVVSDITADFEKIGRLESDIAAVATQTTTAQKTTDIDSELLVIANFQADGTTNVVGESAITSTATMSVSAVKTASAVSTSQAHTSVTAEVSRIRPFAVLVFSLGDLTATAERSRNTTADLAAENTFTANVGKIIQAECNFGSLFTPSVSIRKIFINIYVYRIPREDRTYRIKAETRSYVIPQETRIYNIRR